MSTSEEPGRDTAASEPSPVDGVMSPAPAPGVPSPETTPQTAPQPAPTFPPTAHGAEGAAAVPTQPGATPGGYPTSAPGAPAPAGQPAAGYPGGAAPQYQAPAGYPQQPSAPSASQPYNTQTPGANERPAVYGSPAPATAQSANAPGGYQPTGGYQQPGGPQQPAGYPQPGFPPNQLPQGNYQQPQSDAYYGQQGSAPGGAVPAGYPYQQPGGYQAMPYGQYGAHSGPAKRRPSVLAWISLGLLGAGALVALIGVFLPFLTREAGGETRSMNILDGNMGGGIAIIAVALLAVVGGLLANVVLANRTPKLLCGLLALLGGAFLVIFVLMLFNDGNVANELADGAERGMGAFLTLFGSIAVLIGGFGTLLAEALHRES